MAGKIDRPPPLPGATLAQVLRVASIDGRILLFVAGAFALMSAAGREGLGAVAGVLAAGAGAVELHGVTLLRQRLLVGLRWLVRAQLLLLVVILTYATIRFFTFDDAAVARLITPDMERQFTEAGLTRDDIVPLVHLLSRVTSVVVGLVALGYQGGLALFYHRRRTAVAAALARTG